MFFVNLMFIEIRCLLAQDEVEQIATARQVHILLCTKQQSEPVFVASIIATRLSLGLDSFSTFALSRYCSSLFLYDIRFLEDAFTKESAIKQRIIPCLSADETFLFRSYWPISGHLFMRLLTVTRTETPEHLAVPT